MVLFLKESVYSKIVCVFFKKYRKFVFYTNQIYGHLNTDFTIINCLFWAVKLTKNANPDKCKYRNHGIEFYCCWELLRIDKSMERNAIIFGVDNSSSVHSNKTILVLG